jgi:hypothetical protein
MKIVQTAISAICFSFISLPAFANSQAYENYRRNIWLRCEQQFPANPNLCVRRGDAYRNRRIRQQDEELLEFMYPKGDAGESGGEYLNTPARRRLQNEYFRNKYHRGGNSQGGCETVIIIDSEVSNICN